MLSTVYLSKFLFFKKNHILDIWDARNFNKCTYSYELWYYMYMSNCPWFIFCCWKISRKCDWKLLMSFPLTCAFFFNVFWQSSSLPWSLTSCTYFLKKPTYVTLTRWNVKQSALYRVLVYILTEVQIEAVGSFSWPQTHGVDSVVAVPWYRTVKGHRKHNLSIHTGSYN